MSSWVRLDDSFSEHPKVVQAGDRAAWLFVCGLLYASRTLSNGFVPASQVSRLCSLRDTQALAKRLVSVGLWVEVEDGYVIHDYLEHQRSAAQVKEERRKSAERVKKHRAKKEADVTPLHPTSVTELEKRREQERTGEENRTTPGLTSVVKRYGVIAPATTSGDAA